MLVRPLLCMSVVFVSGIAFSLLNMGLVFVAVMVLVLFFGAKFLLKAETLLCFFVAFCFVLGFMRMGFAEKERDIIGSTYDGKSFVGEMLVTEFSRDGRVTASFEDKGNVYKTYLCTDSLTNLYPGDILKGSFSLSRPIKSKTGISDFSSYLCSQGVFLSARSDDAYVSGRYTEGIKGQIYKIRRYMDKVSEENFSGNTRALFGAMVFGDKSLMTPQLDNSLKASGISHIAVVSGMHIAAIIAALNLLFGKLFGKRRYVHIFTLAGAATVTMLTGAGAGVMRAFVMCAVYLFSRLLYRDSDILTSLGFTVMILLLINPFMLFNVGFVLSVLCVLGIVLFSKKIQEALEKVFPPRLSAVMAVCISAQLCAMPVLLTVLKTVNFYGIISNILVAPISTALVVLGMVLFLVAPLGTAEPVRFLLQLSSDVTEAVSMGISKLPGAMFEIGKADGFFSVCWIFMLVIIYFYPLRLRRVNLYAGVLAVILIIMAVEEETIKTKMYFAQYGGKSLSAISLDKELLLIDCPDYYDAKTLEEETGKNISCVILTEHNTGQLEKLMENSPPDVVIVADIPFEEEFAEKMANALKTGRKSRIIRLKDGKSLKVGGARIEYFSAGNKKAVRILYKGTTFVTLQGLGSEDIENMVLSGEKVECDYLKLPFIPLHENTDLNKLTEGEIIVSSRIVTAR